MSEDARERDALAVEEADAWFEYLDATRSQPSPARYDEVEPWAWARLRQRLRALSDRQATLRSAA